MGCKSIREHYGSKLIVKMNDGRVHIGQGYLGSALVVNLDGSIHEESSSADRGDLGRCRDSIRKNPDVFVELLNGQDRFERSILVYTWQGNRIIEAYCEELEWPNITHDGDLMHENRYSQDRDEVVGWAIEDARSGIDIHRRHIIDLDKQMTEHMTVLAKLDAVLMNLERDEKGSDAKI